MRAVVFTSGTVSCQEVEDPAPGTGEVLVAVKTAGLNGADVMQLAGHYPPPPGIRADRPGLELAGTVAALGPGTSRFALGDAVMGIVGGAAQAEVVAIHERAAMPVPKSLSLAVAGGFPETYLTAHDALVTQAGLRSGERLLVTGAAGGVGTAAVQLAVAIGAEVVAEVRSSRLRAAIEALGAVAADSGEAHRLGPFDVVLELVGAPYVAADLASLSTGGRIAVIGIGGGARGEIDLGQLLTRRARVFGSTLRSRPLEEKAIATRLVERQVLPLVEAGRLEVLVEQTYPVEEAAVAYERFASGGKLGKILLSFD